MAIYKIQLRRDDYTAWQSNNPTLAEGEIGVEFSGTTTSIKVGDGATPWNSLAYITGSGGGGSGTSGSSGSSGTSGSSGSSGINGGGAESLTGLTDVLLTTPTYSQVLAFDGSVWINSGVTGGGGSGSSGSSGTSGSSGSSGTSGGIGSSGSSGSSGTEGAPGSAGSAGSSGTSGSDGSAGSSGTSGSSGLKGDPGDPGASGPYIRVIDPLYAFLGYTIQVSGHSFTSDGELEIGGVLHTANIHDQTSDYFEVDLVGSNVFYPNAAEMIYTNFTGTTSKNIYISYNPTNAPVISRVANHDNPTYLGMPMGEIGDTISFSGINFTTTGLQTVTFGDLDTTGGTTNRLSTYCEGLADGKYFGMYGVTLSNVSGFTSNPNFILFSDQPGPMPNITSITNLTANSYFGGGAGILGWGFLNMYTPLYSGTSVYQGHTNVFLKSSSGNLTLVPSITNIVGAYPQACDCTFTIPQNFQDGEYDVLLVTDYGLASLFDTLGQKFVVTYYAPPTSAAEITRAPLGSLQPGQIAELEGINFNLMEGQTHVYFASGNTSHPIIFESDYVKVNSDILLEFSAPVTSFIGNSYIGVFNGVSGDTPAFDGSTGFWRGMYWSGATTEAMPDYSTKNELETNYYTKSGTEALIITASGNSVLESNSYSRSLSALTLEESNIYSRSLSASTLEESNIYSRSLSASTLEESNIYSRSLSATTYTQAYQDSTGYTYTNYFNKSDNIVLSANTELRVPSDGYIYFGDKEATDSFRIRITSGRLYFDSYSGGTYWPMQTIEKA